MYILTSRLVALKGDSIPLPWYHRAPLGFMSGTPVHVALQTPPRPEPGARWRPRAFGDLLISVVDPANWRHVREITASRADEPGVLADVYQAAPPLNIVFAEAVTVDGGSRHEAQLVLEPFRPGLDETRTEGEVERGMDNITAKLNAGEFQFDPDQPYEDAGELAWMDVGTLALGWAHVAGWREALAEQEANAPDADRYDLTFAVVSADTRRRVLRYVFPRRGAVTLRIEHSDRPGAMGQIAAALAIRGLNILSSLLRRGSAPPYKAELVVVVEPDDATTDETKVAGQAIDALKHMPVELRVRTETLQAVDPSDPDAAVLYPRRPDEIAVRPSRPMAAAIRVVKDELPRDHYPVFISRRFTEGFDPHSRRIVGELRRILEENGCVPVEATPQPGVEIGASDDVKARMWASRAAILLVTSTPEEPQFSLNLAHECGFMQGQGKPLLPLVQKDFASHITRVANLQGLQFIEFSKQDASSAIGAAVAGWLERLGQGRPLRVDGYERSRRRARRTNVRSRARATRARRANTVRQRT
jgi:hypothetical protein